jgi:adenylylsulfate kinase-like enzyme
MVIVITGPIASGKSTVAAELARVLALAGVRASVIDLDLVYDELIAKGSAPDESTWTLARHETARYVNSFLANGQAVVIAEGSFNLPSDRTALVELLRPGSCPVFVTLKVSFEEALRRAQADTTRGRSQEPLFLRDHFDARRQVLAAPPATDIVIDTQDTSAKDAAETIARQTGFTVG